MRLRERARDKCPIPRLEPKTLFVNTQTRAGKAFWEEGIIIYEFPDR
jgi:hypothetical protein